MNTYATRNEQVFRKTPANNGHGQQTSSAVQLKDNRPRTAQLRKVQHMMQSSTKISKARQLKTVANPSSVHQQHPIQQKSCSCPACTKANPISQPIQTKAVIQRYCGVPGCSDPHCHDPKNHKISSFRRLRNVDIYHAERDKSDLGKGSGTSSKTRKYVQDPKSFYPDEVSLAYSSKDGSETGGSSYIQPTRTPGMKPDAGHIFGNQYGGSGKDTANIFAQEPRHNRGNSYKGKRTFEKWRKTENKIRGGIQKGKRMRVTAKLYRKRRKKYDPSTISDAAYRAFMNRWYYRRHDDNNDKGGGGIAT